MISVIFKRFLDIVVSTFGVLLTVVNRLNTVETKSFKLVIPVKTGIHSLCASVAPRLRGDDRIVKNSISSVLKLTPNKGAETQ